MSQQNQSPAGLRFRVNNRNSGLLRTRESEDSNGATPPTPEIPHDQNDDRRPLTTKKRQYKTIKWTKGEKSVIFECFSYSRHECWGRQKTKVFEEQINAADLPQEKVDQTSIPNLNSMVSVIQRCLTHEEINDIQQRGRARAERDFSDLSELEKQSFDKSFWTQYEKWTILWATQYATLKFKTQRQSSKEWLRIFSHHCPNKSTHTRAKLTTQKHNILSSNVFSGEQINEMHTNVENMIQNNVCPIQNPVPIPAPILPDVDQQPPPPMEEEDQQIQANAETNNHENNEVNLNNSVALDDNEDHGSPPNETQSTTVLEESFEDDLERVRLEEQLLNTIEEVKRMPMNKRPRLVKIIETKTFKKLLSEVNSALSGFAEQYMDMNELDAYTFGAALYIQRTIAPWVKEEDPVIRKQQSEPPWKTKIKKKINTLRAEISQMTKNEPLTRSLINRVHRIQRKYNIDSSEFKAKVAEHQVTLKGLSAELRNKEQKIENKRINSLFKENPRAVYRELKEETISVDKPPDKTELENFWRPLFETAKDHQENDWVDLVITKNDEKPEMLDMFITPDVIKNKVKQFSNFKKPGINKVPNFWLKNLQGLHDNYARCFTNLIRCEEEAPEWFTTGTTSLLPKSKETTKPNKYRPICCLPTAYKLLTGLIADAVYDHLETGKYLEEEQKGCKRRQQGTKDQLLINRTILEDCKARSRNLSMAWVDYKKAYDSVPHSWLIRCLDLYKISPTIKKFLAHQMKKWKTNITLKHNNGDMQIPDVKIRRGIFQGDSLSPLLFCIAIDPLSKIIKNENIGYSLSKSRKKADKAQELISHLLFMDDLKLYAADEKGLDKLIRKVHAFSRDIGMEFGLDKCAKCVIEAGKKVPGQKVEIDEGQFVEDLESDTTYKYLGIEENSTFDHKHLRKKAAQE